MGSLPADRAKELVEYYLAGGNVRALAKSFNVAVQTIYNILERNGVSRVRLDTAHLVNACRKGASIKETAEHFGVSKSTILRAVQAQRAEGECIKVERGRPRSSKQPFRFDPEPSASAKVDARTIDEVCAHLQSIAFPFPQMLSAEKIDRELERLHVVPVYLDGDKILPLNPLGVKLCAPFFPNRYKGVSKGSTSAFDAWHDDDALHKAVRFQLEHGDPVRPQRVLRAITLRHRTPTIFRPLVARFIYERYCPRGGRTWDPCSGFGGRLLGAFIAGVEYIGTDVDQLTVEGNLRLAETVGAAVEMHTTAAEAFTPPSVDLVFTSPPYFDRERYSQAAAQSWKYGDLDAWCRSFLRPMIERSSTALRVAGHLVLNIADLRERKTIIPLVRKTIETACTTGFVHVETLRMPLAAINRKAPSEPVLVFQKQ